MPNTLILKRRIKSVGNVKQITKAMELTAAAKMHRAQGAVLGARPYAARALELVHHLIRQEGAAHPLLTNRTPKKQLLILVTTDRGLAGGLNAALVRETVRFIKESDVPSELMVVGKKGIGLLQRYSLPVIAQFTGHGSASDSLATRPISLLAQQRFLNQETDLVYVAYNHFQSTMVQKPTITQLLPFREKPAEADAASDIPLESLLEPNVGALLDTLLPRLVDQLFFQITLESHASEFAARMVAMRNATDNASDLLEDLGLTFNGIRQSSITAQMAEISASITALEA